MKAFIFLFCVLPLLACSRSSNSGPAANTGSGVFIPDSSAKPILVTAPGKPCDKSFYDSRLKEGQFFKYATTNESQNEPLIGFATTETVTKIDASAQTIYVDTRFEDFLGSAKPYTTYTHCSYKGTSPDCYTGGVSTATALPSEKPLEHYNNINDGKNEFFFILNSESSETTSEVGYFRFSDGRQVHATRTTKTITGIVTHSFEDSGKSKSKELGMGKQVSTEVVSVDVPSLNPYFCSGDAEPIYSEELITSEAGETYLKYVHQMTSSNY